MSWKHPRMHRHGKAVLAQQCDDLRQEEGKIVHDKGRRMEPISHVHEGIEPLSAPRLCRPPRRPRGCDTHEPASGLEYVRDLSDKLALLLGQDMSESSKADGHLEGSVKRHRQHITTDQVDAGIPSCLIRHAACNLKHSLTYVNAYHAVA